VTFFESNYDNFLSFCKVLNPVNINISWQQLTYRPRPGGIGGSLYFSIQYGVLEGEERNMLKMKEFGITVGASVVASILTTVLTVFVLSESGASAGPSPPPAFVPALAEQAPRAAPVFGVPPPDCAADLMKFCAEEEANDKEMSCLQMHYDQASPACRTRLQAIRENRFAACKEDIAKFCASAAYGGGRMENCLREAGSKLSQNCAHSIRQH
jgi:Cysteine rich repeat